MPDLSGSLTALRGSHSARYFVSAMLGDLLLTGSVGSATTTAITYTIDTGAETDVRPGMRVVITDAAGAFKGVCSVRYSGSISSTNLPIRETSPGSVSIVATDKFKVYRDFVLTDKLVESSADFNPDGLAVGNENDSAIRPLACSGGWYAGMMTGSSLVISLVGTESTTVDVNSAGTETHLWATTAGTLSSTSSVTPTLTVTAAGYYLVAHTVTDDTNSASEVQYIPIRVHDASDMPYECILSSVDGDPQSGFRCSFELFEDATLDDLPDGSPVIVWADESINGTTQSFGAKGLGRSHILMMGYLRRDTSGASGDDGLETVEFEVISPLARLAELPAFSKVMLNAEAVGAWSELTDLSVSRAIIQILRYYTNLLSIFDFTFLEYATDAGYSAFYLQKSNPLDQVRELADAIDSRLICDRAGRFELQRRLECTPLADRTSAVTTITLTDTDVIDYEVTREHWRPVETFRLRGFIKGYEPATVFARYPATPGTGNSSVAIEKIIAQSADDALARCAMRGAYENRDFFDADALYRHAPKLTITLSGAYARLIGFYREWIALSGITNLRGIDLSDFRFIAESVSETYEDGTAACTLTLQAETNGNPDQAVDDTPLVEVAPPTQPPVVYPPVNVNPPTDGNGLGDFAGTLAVWDATNNKVWITYTLDRMKHGGTPSWAGYSLSLTGILAGFTLHAGSSVNGYLVTTEQVRSITDIFGARTLGTAHSWANGAVTYARQVAVQSERGNPTAAIAVAYHDMGGVSAARTTDSGGAWAEESSLPAFYDNNLPGNAGVWSPGVFVDPAGSGTIIVSACTATTSPPGADFWQSSDNGATFTKILTSGYVAGSNPVGCIAKPLGRPDVLFHGSSNGSIVLSLKRIIGTTQTDITPQYGGNGYGVGAVQGSAYNAHINRSISVADDDPNAVVVCGYNYSLAQWGVFQTFNGLDSSPTWTPIFIPAAGVKYYGAYYVNRSTIYLYGDTGKLAVCKFASGAWTLYETTISGCDAIVGLCGG